MFIKFQHVWNNMIVRCNNKQHPQYKYYGGRGIKVCKRWLKYENFEEDMYDEYGYWFELNHNKRNTVYTLDRINNNGNYSKNNCKWSTQKEQCKNRRNGNIGKNSKSHRTYIKINNIIKSRHDWLKLNGISNEVYYQRIKRGWDKISAMSIPVKKILARKF